MSTVGGMQSEKVEHRAQLQNFALSNGFSKSLLHSSAFVAKSGAQSLTFKSDQTKKLNVFGRPGGGWNPSQTKLAIDMVMEDRARPCTSKTFGGLMHSFDARER